MLMLAKYGEVSLEIVRSLCVRWLFITKCGRHDAVTSIAQSEFSSDRMQYGFYIVRGARHGDSGKFILAKTLLFSFSLFVDFQEVKSA